MDGQIRFEYATFGWEYFMMAERISCGFKNTLIHVEGETEDPVGHHGISMSSDGRLRTLAYA